MSRHEILPCEGALLIFTDLHGNGDDFRALRGRFEDQLARDPGTHAALLGDLVHAPDEKSRGGDPALYDYPDESWGVVEGVAAMKKEHPGRIHLVLGNHDWGHVGGPRTSKFHADEVQHLEDQLSSEQLTVMRRLFVEGRLLLFAPCGVVLSHGSPGDRLRCLDQLERLSLDPAENSAEDARLLETILTSYGQQDAESAAFLRRASAAVELPLSVVIHGHDREEDGWFSEGSHQVCPVIFGAPREAKRYVKLDLSGVYRTAADIRDGVELRQLHD